jgi:hypothetical protein
MNLDQLFACTRSSFREFYAELRRCFEAVDRFHVVEADNCSKLPWPIGQGVYAIWQGSGRTASSLVYVGMTGKMSNANGRTELPDKPKGFRARAERTNPYSFTSKGPFENHFEFGPRFSSKSFGTTPLDSRYDRRLPIGAITIHCFVIESSFKIAPAFLEALILQHYISSEGRLPEANNKF